jgi:hypothetical protein
MVSISLSEARAIAANVFPRWSRSFCFVRESSDQTLKLVFPEFDVQPIHGRR